MWSLVHCVENIIFAVATGHNCVLSAEAPVAPVALRQCVSPVSAVSGVIVANARLAK